MAKQMAAEKQKVTNTIVKVDKKLYREFIGHGKIVGMNAKTALETGMRLFIAESKKSIRDEK